MEDNNSIYKKIRIIQSKAGLLTKSDTNKFQNYKYFTEYDCLKILKPLLEENNLLITFDDDNEKWSCEKEGKEWIVKYLKRMIITNCNDAKEQLIFNFWACGQNTDIAKAKGSAETYSMKYFLSKFFLIPSIEEDPDKRFFGS